MRPMATASRPRAIVRKASVPVLGRLTVAGGRVMTLSPLASRVLITVADSTGAGDASTVEVSLPVVVLFGLVTSVTVVVTVSVSAVPRGGAGAVNVQVTAAAGARFWPTSSGQTS